jgi:diguanylate cyclase (GGDEF)-like protein/PAS domain S-box-containing protein
MTEITHEQLLHSLFDGVYYVDMNKKITFWNKAAERITGFKQEEVVGSCCADNILRHINTDGEELCTNLCPLQKTLKDGQIREANLFLHHKEGYRVPVMVRIAPIRNNQGEIIGGIEIFSDHSDRLQLLQEVESLKQEAYTDKLTGTGNRRYAEQIVNAKLFEMKTYQVYFGLIFLDIDHFKGFNDRYGHKTGDAVLCMVVKTVGNILRKFDAVCRWGGEEFLVIIANTDDPTLKKVSERIRIFIEKSFLTIGGDTLQITASLGGTLSRATDTLESVIERADTLMYESKKSGRNRVTIG